MNFFLTFLPQWLVDTKFYQDEYNIPDLISILLVFLIAYPSENWPSI